MGRASSTAIEWYTGRDDAQAGPFKSADIENQIMSGHLREQDLLWRSGWPQWRRVGEVFREVFDALKASTAPTPPPLPLEALAGSPAELGRGLPATPVLDPISGTIPFGSVMSGLGQSGRAPPPAKYDVEADALVTEIAADPPVSTSRLPWRQMTWAGRLGLLFYLLLVLAGSVIFAVMAYVSFDILKSNGFSRHFFLLGAVPVLSWLMLLLAITRVERRSLQIVLSLISPVAIGALALLLNPKVSLFWDWINVDGSGRGLGQGVLVAPGAYPEREPLLLATFVVSSLLLLLTGFPWRRRGEIVNAPPSAGGRIPALGKHAWLLGFLSLAGGLVMLARDPAQVEFFRPPLLQPHELQFNSVALSPDGGRVLTSSNDSTVRIWDIASRAEVLKMQGGGRVMEAVFDAAGERVAAISEDGYVRIWNAGTGAVVKAFSGDTPKAMTSVAFNPAGTLLLIGSEDGLARIFDASDGAPKVTLKGHEGAVKTAAFSGDGKEVLTVSRKAAKLWSAADGMLIRTFDGYESDLNYGLFHPEGRDVLLSEGLGDANAGHIVDLASGKERVRLDWAGYSGAYSRDGTRLAVSGRTVHLYDAASGMTLGSLRYDSRVVDATEMKAVALDATGSTLVTTLDFNAAVWDTKAYLAGDFAAADLSATLGKTSGASFPMALSICAAENFGTVNWLALAPNSREAMAGTESGAVMACSADSTELVKEDNDQGEPSIAGAISPDGKLYAGATKGKGVRLWQLADGGLHQSLNLDGVQPATVRFSADSKRVAVGLNNGTARIFDANVGTPLFVLQAAPDGRGSVGADFARDGTAIVTRATNGWTSYIKLWDAADGKLKRSFTSESSPAAKGTGTEMWGEVLADGTILVVNQRQIIRISADGTQATELFNIKPVETGSVLPDSIVLIAVDAKGQRMAAAFRSGALRVLDIASGKIEAELFGHTAGEIHRSSITTLTFHPSGDYLLSVGYDGTLRFWDIARPGLVRTLRGGVEAAQFSNDGNLVVAAQSVEKSQKLTFWDFERLITRPAATDSK